MNKIAEVQVILPAECSGYVMNIGDADSKPCIRKIVRK